MEKVKNELSIHPIIAPAIVADNSDTIVPANIALKPSSINIGFTLGAITPIPQFVFQLMQNLRNHITYKWPS